MKKMIYVFLSAMMFGCTVSGGELQITNDTPINTETEQEEPKEIIRVLTEVEFAHPYTPGFMLENSDVVAVAKVISIDHSDMKSNTVIGYTDGTAEIIDVIYGDMDNSVFSYKKPGCIVSAKEYEETYSDAEMDKILHLREENGWPENYDNLYYDTTLEEDIHIEEGHTYFMYLNYIESMDQYEIIGLGNGLREIRYTDGDYDRGTEEIKNNTTGEYENLSDYCREYILYE